MRTVPDYWSANEVSNAIITQIHFKAGGTDSGAYNNGNDGVADPEKPQTKSGITNWKTQIFDPTTENLMNILKVDKLRVSETPKFEIRTWIDSHLGGAAPSSLVDPVNDVNYWATLPTSDMGGLHVIKVRGSENNIGRAHAENFVSATNGIDGWPLLIMEVVAEAYGGRPGRPLSFSSQRLGVYPHEFHHVWKAWQQQEILGTPTNNSWGSYNLPQQAQIENDDGYMVDDPAFTVWEPVTDEGTLPSVYKNASTNEIIEFVPRYAASTTATESQDIKNGGDLGELPPSGAGRFIVEGGAAVFQNMYVKLLYAANNDVGNATTLARAKFGNDPSRWEYMVGDAASDVAQKITESIEKDKLWLMAFANALDPTKHLSILEEKRALYSISGVPRDLNFNYQPEMYMILVLAKLTSFQKVLNDIFIVRHDSNQHFIANFETTFGMSLNSFLNEVDTNYKISDDPNGILIYPRNIVEIFNDIDFGNISGYVPTVSPIYDEILLPSRQYRIRVLSHRNDVKTEVKNMQLQRRFRYLNKDFVISDSEVQNAKTEIQNLSSSSGKIQKLLFPYIDKLVILDINTAQVETEEEEIYQIFNNGARQSEGAAVLDTNTEYYVIFPNAPSWRTWAMPARPGGSREDLLVDKSHYMIRSIHDGDTIHEQIIQLMGEANFSYLDDVWEPLPETGGKFPIFMKPHLNKILKRVKQEGNANLIEQYIFLYYNNGVYKYKINAIADKGLVSDDVDGDYSNYYISGTGVAEEMFNYPGGAFGSTVTPDGPLMPKFFTFFRGNGAVAKHRTLTTWNASTDPERARHEIDELTGQNVGYKFYIIYKTAPSHITTEELANLGAIGNKIKQNKRPKIAAAEVGRPWEDFWNNVSSDIKKRRRKRHAILELLLQKRESNIEFDVADLKIEIGSKEKIIVYNPTEKVDILNLASDTGYYINLFYAEESAIIQISTEKFIKVTVISEGTDDGEGLYRVETSTTENGDYQQEATAIDGESVTIFGHKITLGGVSSDGNVEVTEEFKEKQTIKLGRLADLSSGRARRRSQLRRMNSSGYTYITPSSNFPKVPRAISRHAINKRIILGGSIPKDVVVRRKPKTLKTSSSDYIQLKKWRHFSR